MTLLHSHNYLVLVALNFSGVLRYRDFVSLVDLHRNYNSTVDHYGEEQAQDTEWEYYTFYAVDIHQGPSNEEETNYDGHYLFECCSPVS